MATTKVKLEPKLDGILEWCKDLHCGLESFWGTENGAQGTKLSSEHQNWRKMGQWQQNES